MHPSLIALKLHRWKTTLWWVGIKKLFVSNFSLSENENWYEWKKNFSFVFWAHANIFVQLAEMCVSRTTQFLSPLSAFDCCLTLLCYQFSIFECNWSVKDYGERWRVRDTELPFIVAGAIAEIFFSSLHQKHAILSKPKLLQFSHKIDQQVYSLGSENIAQELRNIKPWEKLKQWIY